MKTSLKAGIILFILSISFFNSSAQVAGTTGSAVTIPAGEARLVLTIADESDFNKTAFDWRLESVKDAQTATAIASGIKAKNGSIKNISITPNGKAYAVHLESNSVMEAYQYFQMFVAEGVKYALINNKATNLVSYIQKKTGK